MTTEPSTGSGAERYARQRILDGFGDTAQQRLAAARVLVVGAGGLGSPVIQYLAGAGVGTLGVADDDAVSLSNLHRQVIHGGSAPGTAKTASASAAVAALNPLVAVREHGRVTADTVAALLAEYDLVVDAADTFATTLLLDAACAAQGVPLIWGSVLRWDGQLTVLSASDGASRAARRLADLYPAAGDAAEDCATAGVIGPVCGAIGSAMATEAIKLITGIGRPLIGRLLVHDGLEGSWREVAFAAAGAASAASSETGAEAHPEPLTTTADARPAAIAAPIPLTVTELFQHLQVRDSGLTDFLLLDVREPWEHELAAIDGSELLPLGRLLEGTTPAADLAGTVLVHCHHDTRSRIAAEALTAAGFSDVRWIEGGIDAWSREIDPGVPRY